MSHKKSKKHCKKCPSVIVVRKEESSSDSTVSEKSTCEKKSDCGRIHVIRKVPYTITKSGKYCVKKDLVFSGTGAAITITANNVTLNLHNHDLTLNDLSAVGILATGVRELTIENDIIQTLTVSTINTNAAIQLVSGEKVTLKNIFTKNTFYGVLIQSSSNVLVTHSEFKDHIGGNTVSGTIYDSFGIQADASNNVVIEESTFIGINQISSDSGPIGFINGCLNCRVSKCQLTETNLLLARQINGLIIEDCLFQGPATAQYGLIQLGASASTALANDVIIRNCTMISQSLTIGPSVIAAGRGSNCLIENCSLDLSANNQFGSAFFTVFYNNITLRHCTIQGSTITQPSTATIDLIGPNNVIDNCQIVGGSPQGVTIVIDVGSSNTVIKNSDISGSQGGGILVLGTVPNTAIINNIVRDNVGNGIEIDTGSINTRAELNKVFSNTGIGIANFEPSSQIFFNTSCGNGTDCVGIDSSVVQTPGASPAVAGSNVCCSSAPLVTATKEIKEWTSKKEKLSFI